MKILHCCLAAFYIDNYDYQENSLTRTHKAQGHEVMIVASTESYDSNKEICYLKPSNYFNQDGINVVRLPYLRFLPSFVASKIRWYEGLSAQLELFNPDLIFLHDIQFLSVLQIRKYLRKHANVKLVVDGHTDFGNSAKTPLSLLFHKTIYRFCAKSIEHHASVFWGVTPARVNFFTTVYGINQKKTALLELGVDDVSIDIDELRYSKNSIRKKFGLKENSLLVFFGGKIEKRKRIFDLLYAFEKLKNHNIELCLVGEAKLDIKDDFLNLVNSNENIKFLGWREPIDVIRILASSDIACFPGSHSVLWEQAVGIGIPIMVPKKEDYRYLDFGKNCIFLEAPFEESIQRELKNLVNKKSEMTNISKNANSDGRKKFLYSAIGVKSIKNS